jgi:hypothetical protein
VPNTLRVQLKEFLSYDPVTGVFIWRKDRPCQVRCGTIAGRLTDRGYRQIMVNRTRYAAHRLAWFYFYGMWPKEQIDHRDGNKDNNAISNLREATNGQNNANGRKYRNYADLPKGVTKVSGKISKPYRGQIRAGGKQFHLGYFATAEDAHSAYCLAANRHFGQFARTQ